MPSTEDAAISRSPGPVSTAAVADLLGLLVPGHPLPDPRAQAPFRRLGGGFDRLSERLQLRGRVEPQRTAGVELVRLELRFDVRPQTLQVARDGPIPAPIG